MTLAFDMCPIRENGDCLSIINVNNPYGYDDELQCTDIVEKCETIGDLMSSI